jgi:PAS domain S-box-containing protein
MRYTPFIWPMIFAALMNVGLAIYARRYRSVPGALAFQVLMGLSAATAACYAGEISFTTLSAKVFFAELRIVPSSMITTILLALALEYSGLPSFHNLPEWLRRPQVRWLFIIPAVSALLSISGQLHHLFRYDFQILASNQVSVLTFKHGWWWYIYFANNTIVACSAWLLFVTSLRRRSGRATWAILLAILFSGLVDILFALGLTPTSGYYWTPATFSVTSLLFAYALLRGRLFDFSPIALRTVFENIDDLVIVLDQEGHIVEFNRAARTACGLNQTAIGCLPEQALSAEWARIIRLPEGGIASSQSTPPAMAHPEGEPAETAQKQRFKIELEIAGVKEQRSYELTLREIKAKQAGRLGTLFMLHDITAGEAMEQALRQAQAGLEQRVQERTSALEQSNLTLQHEADRHKKAVQAVWESEVKYRTLFETMSQGVVYQDRQERMVMANPAAQRILGLDSEQMIGKGSPDFNWRVIHEDGSPFPHETYPAMEALRTGKEVHNVVMGYYNPILESVRWVNVSATPQFLPGEDLPYQVYATLEDISERKQIEQAMRESEAKFRQLVETASEGVVVMDAEHKISYINPQVTEITGYTFEQVRGRPGIEFTYPEDRVEQERLLSEREQGMVGKYERKFRHASGRSIWILVSSSPLVDQDGQVSGSFSMLSDISERKQAEQALHESEERFRKLAETTSTAILVIQGEHFTYVNHACEEIGGYTQKELLKMKFWQLMPETEHEFIRQRGLQRQNGVPTPERLEVRLIRKDGGVRWLDYTATPVSWGGKAAIIGTAFDITERKLAQEAEREQRRLAEALRDSAAALTSSLSLDEVLDQIIASVERVIPALGSPVITILLIRPDGWVEVVRQLGLLEREGGETMSQMRFPLDDTPNMRWMADTGLPLVIADTHDSPDWNFQPEWGWIRSSIGAPICIKGDAIGFIILVSETSGVFNEQQAKRLEAFAAQAAIAIENAQLYEEAQNARERLRALSLRLVQVQESERRHLARELHDEIGQALTALKLNLEATTGELVAPVEADEAVSDETKPDSKPDRSQRPVRLDDAEKIQDRLRQARGQVSELIARTRELSLSLRPAMLDDLGLLPTLIWHIDRYQEQTGIQVSFTASGLEESRFMAEVETAAFRIVQEALTNVARHAAVNQAVVQIWIEPPALYLLIEDHGVGFDATIASPESAGLAGMQERVGLLGGTLTVDSTPGSGTRLVAMLPV